MTSGLLRSSVTFAWIVGALLVIGGCGQTGGDADAPAEPASNEAAVDDHSGWWCAAHGVPEEECSRCSAKAAEDFKAAGDWCEEHNRAESQCFLCGPDRADKFAALYEAKFGEQPPAIQ